MKLLFAPILFISLTLFSQNWETVQTFGGFGNESLDALEIMDDGKIIIAGSFEESFEIGGNTLVTEGEEDIYCSIYNEEGNHIQSFRIGGAFEEQLAAVASHGNLITLLGSYHLQANFDTMELETSLGTKGLFICQYNTEGEVQWAHSIEGNILSISGDVALSDNGESFITGYFFDTLIVQQDTLLANSEEGDLFVAKLDAGGMLQWLRQAGNEGIMRSVSIVVDADGDILIAGKFKGEATFGGATIQTNTSDHDIFVAKLDSQGDFLWGKKLGGVFEEDFGGMAVDGNRNIYLTGYFLGVMSSAEGWGIQTDGMNLNAYLIQLSPAGVVNWGHSIGGTNDDYGIDVSVGNDRIVMTGYFLNSTDWGNGHISAEGGLDALLASYDGEGNLLGTIPISGTDFEFGAQVGFLPSGEIIAGGSFNGSCEFDGDSYSSNGSFDVYWAVRNGLVSVDETSAAADFSFYPNPSSRYIHWKHTPYIYVCIFDAAGKTLLGSDTGSMDIGHLAPGVYFIKAEGYASVGKIVICH